MTVEELIEELKKWPKGMKVYISGYEGGINDVQNLIDVNVQRDVHEEWYYGAHETVGDDDWFFGRHRDPDKKWPPTEKGVLIV